MFQAERLLARTFFGRFFESDLMPQGLPQLQVVIWGVALFAGPGYLMSASAAIKYEGMLRHRLVVSAQADQLFFVTFAMMAVGLVALFTWESLFPDRRDVRILGPLPLRTRTHVLGRLGAVTAVAGLFSLAINLPPAVLFGLTLWGHDIASGPVRAIVGHFMATAMGGLFVFFVLMAAQGALLNLFGRRYAQRCALVLQAVFVLMLLQAFLFVPGLASEVRAAFAGDGPVMIRFLPPAWFLAFYERVAGAPQPVPLGYAMTAVLATVGAMGGAVVLLASSYRRLVRIAIETSDDGASSAGRSRQQVWRVLAVLTGKHPVTRATAWFTLCTLTRSRAHLILLATYVGIAAAVALSGVIQAAASGGASAFAEPTVTLLSLPLVVNFIVLCGARVMIAIPTEVRANWVFRFHATANQMAPAIAGVRTALLIALVVPIGIAATVGGAVLWGLPVGVAHGLFTGMLGLLLLESLMVDLRKIPFTCTYYPGRSRAWWPLFAFAFGTYAYVGARLELSILRRPLAVLLAVTVIAAAVAGEIILRRRGLRSASGFTYQEEDPDALFQGFRLSEGFAAEGRLASGRQSALLEIKAKARHSVEPDTAAAAGDAREAPLQP